MPKTERSLWNSLKQNLPKKTHFQRIENRAGQGMPDVYLCMNGVPVWCELKIIKNGRVSLSTSQIAWHLAHTRCGGASFFLVHDPSTGDVFFFEGGKAAVIHETRTIKLCACDPAPAYVWKGPLRAAGQALRACAVEAWGLPE
jgi:hypothetical protein